MKKPIHRADLPADWNRTARVLITEAGSDEDYIVKKLMEDSAALSEAAPLIQKGKKRAETEAKTLGKAREDSKRDADAWKKAAVVIAERWLRKDPRLRLPRQKSELARKVCAELPTLPKRLSSNTVRHCLAEWLKTLPKK